MNKINIAPSTTVLNEKGELRVLSSYDFKGTLGELNEITEALVEQYGKDAECKIIPIVVSNLDDSLHCEIVIMFDSIKNNNPAKNESLFTHVIQGFLISITAITVLFIDGHYDRPPKLGWFFQFFVYWGVSTALIRSFNLVYIAFFNKKTNS